MVQTAGNSSGIGGVIASFASTGSAATLTVANDAPNVAPLGVACMPVDQKLATTPESR